MKRRNRSYFSAAGVLTAVLIALFVTVAAEEPAIRVQPMGTPSDHLVIGLCDGKTQVEVPGFAPGQAMDRETAQTVADAMIAQWLRVNPGATWVMARNSPAEPAPRPAAAPQSRPGPQKQDEVYGRYTDRDQFVWKTELEKFVQEGDRIFHNAEAFGGTVGVSCDMCHPHAANTHPETYPKYQVQLQRVALLRDMINWCLQHATKGQPLEDGDPILRAMEAYILAQRKGTPIEPGKH